MKINLKDNKTRLILFFMITGWIRVLALVIPGVWIYMNTPNLRDNVNQDNQIVETHDYLPTVKMEQRN
jgi:hypothetical protein